MSYCYTKQYNDKGLVVIERGTIRPIWKHFKDNLHDLCPDTNHVTKSREATWCFCANEVCNTERTWIDGAVLNSVPKPRVNPVQDSMGKVAPALH